MQNCKMRIGPLLRNYPEREEERQPLARGHTLSHSLEIERAFSKAWDDPETRERGREHDDTPKASKRRCSSIKSSYKTKLRIRGAVKGGCIVVLLAPFITYLVCIVIFGIICALQQTGVAPKLPCSIFYSWKTLRRHNLADFQIDIGLKKSLNTFAMPLYYTKGVQEVQKSKVLILGLLKDAEDSLPTLTKDIDSILNHIPHSDFVACESCSTDRTRKILTEWRDRHYDGRVSVPSPREWSPSTMNCTKYENEDPFHGVYGVREARLALMRNECLLSTLQKHGGTAYDYLVTLDMDIYRIDYKGVLDSFGAIQWMDEEKQPWSVLCSNGKFVNGIYRDTYAHRTPSIDTGEHHLKKLENRTIWLRDKFMNLKEREKVQRKVNDIVKDKHRRKKLYAVDSCFGGLAIYNMSLVQNCTYYGNSLVNYKAWSSKYLRPDCEHISFNACASGRYKIGFNSTDKKYNYEVEDLNCENCKPVLLNPRMQAWHGKGAWTGMLGPELYYPILFLGWWLMVLDLPLFLFSQDALFLVSWIIVYVVSAATLYLLYQCYSLAKRKSLDLRLRSFLKSLGFF